MVFSQSTQHLIRENEPLAGYTWARIGGPARYYAEPTTSQEVSLLVKEAHAAGLPVRIIGDGSNLLVRDAGCDGIVLNLCAAGLSSIAIDGNTLVAGGGAKLNHVISQSAGAGLAGLEYLAGIPGTLGGAVVCNAAVKNGDIGSRVVRVSGLDESGNAVERLRDSLQFGFRRSNLEGLVVTEVQMQLEPIDPAELTRRMQAAWIVKRATQPVSGTRTLQAFIEPDGMSLTEALEAADMRGYAEGEVKLTSEFPGFVTISGQANSDQVIALIEKVTNRVAAQTGVPLQSQVRIW